MLWSMMDMKKVTVAFAEALVRHQAKHALCLPTLVRDVFIPDFRAKRGSQARSDSVLMK
jgi:hypothetical protein